MPSDTRKRPRRLSATFVRTVNLPGRYGDGHRGHGLSLLVKRTACGGLSKSWTQAIRPGGRTTSIGLGAYPLVTLATARLCERCREDRDIERGQKRKDALDAAAIDEFAARPDRAHEPSNLDCGISLWNARRKPEASAA